MAEHLGVLEREGVSWVASVRQEKSPSW
jgi:hypothetical protein